MRNILKTRYQFAKFYEIEVNEEALPQLPEDMVFSKHLQKMEETFKLPKRKVVGGWGIKQKDKVFSYKQLLDGHPYGSIESFIHKGVDLTLISTNYQRLSDKNLHKLLYKINPSAILVQRRPEYYLRDFRLLPLGSDSVFSDYEYLNQLQVTSDSLRPTQKTMRPLVNALNKTRDDILQQNPEKQILQNQGFNTVLNYTNNYKQAQLYLAQLPMRSFRQWLANSHTLMELQEMFKNICKRLPRYKNFNFSPYQLATFLYPEILLKVNDHYMATLIEMLLATKKHQHIVLVCGLMENIAVKHFLEQDKGLQPIIELLVPPQPKGSIIRNIEQLEIVEKHILIDALFYGKDLPSTKIQFLHTTNAVIQKYCKNMPKDVQGKFRFDKTMEYMSLMEDKIKEGEQEIKKEFVRETLRS